MGKEEAGSLKGPPASGVFGVCGLRGDLDGVVAPGALAVEGDGGDAEVVARPAVEPLDDERGARRDPGLRPAGRRLRVSLR